MSSIVVRKKVSVARRVRAQREVARFKRILRRHLPEIQARYHVKSLGLFGSYVRGEPKKKSDLDILVEYDATPSFFRFIELEEYLSQMLGVRVDLVLRSALKSRIGEHILAEVVKI